MKHTHSMQAFRPTMIIMLLTLVLSMTGPLRTPNALAEPQQAAAVPISCSDTPFGRTLALRQENEIFIGYQNQTPPNIGGLGEMRLDYNASNERLLSVEAASLSTTPPNISSLAGTTADLDGDGKAEFVQGFTNSNGQYQLLVRTSGGAEQNHVEQWANHSERAMAAGDMLGRKDGSQQVVVASRDGSGALHVAIFPGDTTGIGAPAVQWHSDTNNRVNGSQINVAVGNLDNDPYADIVVAFLQADRVVSGVNIRGTGQLVWLEYDPASSTASTPVLRERASTTWQVLDPRNLRMKVGDLTGTGQDTVIVGVDHGPAGGIAQSMAVYNFVPNIINGVPQLTYPTTSAGVWVQSTSAHYFDLAVGDVDGDHRNEIAIAYDTSKSGANYLNVDLLGWTSQNNDLPRLTWLDHWQDGNDGRDQSNYLSLVIADLNKDNRAEIVAAFKDANEFGFQTLYLRGGPNQHMQLIDWERHDPTLNAPVNLVAGDWDNDSLRASITGTCAQVTDANITAASFVPPFWQNMQASQDKGGSMGQSTGQTQNVENSLTYTNASSVSSYIGTGAGFNLFDVFEINASARFGTTKEYATRNRLSTGVLTSTTTTTGRSWNADAVVYKPASFNCYTYQLLTNNLPVPLDQAHVRFCDYQRLTNAEPLQASELNLWDLAYNSKPEYVPVLRDWASLALFRGAFTAQSSTAGAASAARAVDSEIVHGSFVDGTLSQTGNDAHAWWQVDLGASQSIGHIRLWTPPASLSNFYVLVSNNDFRSMPGQDNPANLVNRADVKQYTLADLGNGLTIADTAASETTFTTLDAQYRPIHGRYVRIQQVSTGSLTLAEVQVFGTNHVDPDRYPLDACDSTSVALPNRAWCDVTTNDGYFKVMLYNPWATTNNDAFVPIKVRGHLLWDGRANTALNSLSVTRGNASTDWSMSSEMVTSKVEAHAIGTNTRNGAEYEAEGAAVIKVLGGHGTETTSALDNENIRTTTWSKALNMSGRVSGFPNEYSQPENAWAENCHYRFQPYLYEVLETSNLGVQQRFPILDYLVPQESSAVDLIRGSELTRCRNGNTTSATPHAANDAIQVVANTPLTLNVLANDAGNELLLVDVSAPAHGTVTHTERSIVYTPAAGYSGPDSFIYTMIDTSGQTATGSVTITVGSRTIIYLPLVSH